MCRMLGYSGPPIALERIVTRPCHSLLEQARHSDEAKLAVHGDGFGMAWYVAGLDAPGLYRDVLPAWSDSNLNSLCRVVQSHLFLAHVRASTTGGTSRANCHPFSFGRWSMVHNGQIGAFDQLRRPLEALLPDSLYRLRQGTADSEVLFLLMIANRLEDDAARAIRRTIDQVSDLTPEGAAPNRITCILSDGNRLMGFRHASDGKAPTLYTSRNPLDHGGRALASEPLDGVVGNWDALPNDRLFTLAQQGPHETDLWPRLPTDCVPLAS